MNSDDMPEIVVNMYGILGEAFEDGFNLAYTKWTLEDTKEKLQKGQIKPEDPMGSGDLRSYLKLRLPYERGELNRLLEKYPISASVKRAAEEIYKICDEIENQLESSSRTHVPTA
jgi:hypothetical protein